MIVKIDITGKICYQVPVRVHIRTVRQHKRIATSMCRSNAGAGVRAPIRLNYIILILITQIF